MNNVEIIGSMIEKGVGSGCYARAVTLQSRTLEILRQLDVLDSIFSRGCKMEFGVDIYSDGEPIVSAQLPPSDTPFPGIVSLIQSETEAILESKLNSLGFIVEHNVELIEMVLNANHEATAVIVKHLESGELEQIKVMYIVGCDGGSSTTRKLAGIQFAGETTNITISVLDGDIETSIPGTRFHTIFFSPSACVLMERISRRMIRFILPTGGRQPQFNEEDFLSAIKTTISPYVIKVNQIIRKNSFVLNERQAQVYFKGNIFLCGDSAHVHSPAGGQGLNTGVQDAYNLAWKLALMIRGLGRYKPLTESFDFERGRVAHHVLESSGRLTRFVMSRPTLLTYISKNLVMPYVLSSLHVKQYLSTLLSEVHIKYGPSSLTVETSQAGILRRPFPGVGLRIPDFPLVHPTYHTTSSIHQLLAGGHCFEILIHLPRRMLVLNSINHLHKLLVAVTSWEPLKIKSTEPIFKLTILLKADMFQIHQWANSLISQRPIWHKTVEKTKDILTSTSLFIDQLGSFQRSFLLPDDIATLLILRPDSHLALINPISPQNFSQIMGSYFSSFIDLNG